MTHRKHSNLKKDPLDFLFWKQKEISTLTPRQRKSGPCQKCQKRVQRSVFLKILVGDTVNQVGKIAPGLIKNGSNKISNEAQQRISQIICQAEKKVERVLPKILRETIENVYQTPFRLLRNFGKQQLNKLKNKILC